VVEALKDAVQAVDEGVAAAKAEATVEGTQVGGTPEEATQEAPEAAATARAAALAALTGAPVTPEADTAPVPEVEATGDEVTWAEGNEPLVTGVVAFSVYQARVAGHTMQAYKGQTIHATEAVIGRGVALGAVVRAD
jgi:hypothetical protein